MALIDAIFIITAWLDDAEIEHAKQLELLQTILAQILNTVGLSPKVQSCAELWQLVCRAEWIWCLELEMSQQELEDFDWQVGNFDRSVTWKPMSCLKAVWFAADFSKKFPLAFFTLKDLCASAKAQSERLNLNISYKDGLTIPDLFVDCCNVFEDIYEILCCRPPLPWTAVKQPLPEACAAERMEEDPATSDDIELFA